MLGVWSLWQRLLQATLNDTLRDHSYSRTSDRAIINSGVIHAETSWEAGLS